MDNCEARGWPVQDGFSPFVWPGEESLVEPLNRIALKAFRFMPARAGETCLITTVVVMSRQVEELHEATRN